MRILITGVTGQDGALLGETLLRGTEEHEIYGLVRRFNFEAPSIGIAQIPGDMGERASLDRALRISRPDVIYNLAAVTSPGGGWGTPQPPRLAEVTALGVINLLDAMTAWAPNARLVHASSSAIYDPARYGLYGISKQFAHQAVLGYRRAGLWAANAVLFSHTSRRQDPRFLARRISDTIRRIALGSKETLRLGDVDSCRDWGYAPEHMRALPLIANQSSPEDWVICTGRRRSIREFVEVALEVYGLRWDDVVEIDPDAPSVPHEIPAPPEQRMRTANWLGWRHEVRFSEMVRMMVE